MKLTEQEKKLIKNSINCFIRGIEYSENQDFIDENEDNYLKCKAILTDNKLWDKNFVLLKKCLQYYLLDLFDNEDTDLNKEFLQTQKRDINILIRKINK